LKRWQFRRYNNKVEVNYDCHARRELNSLDYKDAKVNMLKGYKVHGFYHMTKPGVNLNDLTVPGKDRVDPA